MLTTTDRSSKNRLLYASPVGCVSLRSQYVFKHCRHRKNYYLCPSEKQDNQSGNVETGRSDGRAIWRCAWQLKHTYGTPFLMLVTMVMTPNTCSAHARTMYPNRELPRTDYALPTSILEISLMQFPIFFVRCNLQHSIAVRFEDTWSRNFTSAFFFFFFEDDRA